LEGEAVTIVTDEVDNINKSNLIRRLFKRHLLLVQKEKALKTFYNKKDGLKNPSFNF